MRPDHETIFLAQAVLSSQRGTCRRRKVGCVLVDRHNHVLSTGYNGGASGEPHCLDVPCAGADLPSGTGLSTCEAIHAEANALLQCKDVHAIVTAYVTASPCTDCVKLLLNTSCRRVVALKPYTHDAASRARWERSGREWLVVSQETRDAVAIALLEAAKQCS